MFQSTAVIICIGALIISPLTSRSFFNLVPESFRHASLVFGNLIAFWYDKIIPDHSKIILDMFYSRTEITHFSEESGIGKWDLETTIWILGELTAAVSFPGSFNVQS